MAIEREKILDAAFSLLDEAGLDRFTTRRLAERLGVQQPALYWHFAGKAALLDALNHEMLLRFHGRRVPRPDERWDECTLAYARGFPRATRRVGSGPLGNTGPRPTVADVAVYERLVELYVAAGFAAREALAIALSVTRYVVGYVLEEQNERERAETEPDAVGDPLQEVAAFPLLAEAMRPLMRGTDIDTEAVFERGLAYLLTGIRLTLAAKAKPASGNGSKAKRRSAR